MRVVALAALCALCGVLACPLGAAAQPQMVFAQYLERVMDRNLGIAASRRDVTAAEARVQIGARLPDPILSGGLLSFDMSHPTRTEVRTDLQANGTPNCTFPATGGAGAPACVSQLPTILGLGLDIPIELGDQQGRRMDVARVGVRQAGTGVEDTMRVVRGLAAGGWVDALATQIALDHLHQTLASLERLVQMNEARVSAGAIGDVELVQSRVEAQMFRAQVHTADGQVRAALVGLSAFLGQEDTPEPDFTPVGDLTLPPHEFTLARLVEQAMENRPDLRRIQLDIDAARAARELAEAERWSRIDVIGGWLYSFPALDTQYAQTDYHAVSLMLAIPLPFRLLWHGEIDEATAMQSAADARYQQARRLLEVEVRQALARYEAAVLALALFDQSVITDAEHVLEATRYQYEHGGTALISVLIAQRTLNDVYAAYTAALAAHAHALVGVETAAGIWDVDFGTSTPITARPTPPITPSTPTTPAP